VPTFSSGCPFFVFLSLLRGHPCSATLPSFCNPSVSSVGPTENAEPETAASFSSGGFSNYFHLDFHMPSYQTIVTTGYLNNLGDTCLGHSAPLERLLRCPRRGHQLYVRRGGRERSFTSTACSSPFSQTSQSLLLAS
jgi:tripeptidyl-peptidase-1